ncbi:MAG TPA: non-canonical purine NTP pyrophosphatase [Alphaproteobacteria bacterium]|nr:non-canonical purine NTP pyrophosphatase [Alphaproteobacteria bacterium]
MLLFATSNPGKFKRFCDELAPYGLAASQNPLNLMEPQETEIPDVAAHKARQAFVLTGKPVVVEDSGLCIPALNNFPEALTKPVLQRLGLPGFLKILEGLEDRRCFFISCVGYAMADGTVGTIASTHETGELLAAPVGAQRDFAWSALSYVFKPTNFPTSMADFTPAQTEALFAEWRPHNVFNRFARFASQNREAFGLPGANSAAA